jgi:tetratricopeptide (TPR) repeat protein
MFVRIWALALLSIALGACAGGEVAGTPAIGTGAEVAHYDSDQAEQLVQDAQEAMARGDSAAAEISFGKALDVWPASKPAWEGLAEIYREQGRQADLEVANFFAARMDWVAALPPLIASGAFENAAEGRTQIAQDHPDLRRRAAQLVDFLRDREARAYAGTNNQESAN